MGLVYLPTNLPYKSTFHVGKYTKFMGILWEKIASMRGFQESKPLTQTNN